MNRINLEEAKHLQYEMLKEIHRYTEAHGLTYYLAAGTLLGAVRHQGFIPWDDDIDIVMPQPDFEKLMTEYQSERYQAVWCYNNNEYQFVFGRLYDKRTCSKMGRYRGLGAFIDIYVIFGAPATKEEQEERFRKAFRYKLMRRKLIRLRRKLVTNGLWPKKTLDFSWLNRINRKMYECFSVCNYVDSEYIHPYGGGRIIVRKDMYEEKMLMKFEKDFFYAPKYYDELLTIQYGDYMQLPPPEKRLPHHGITANELYWI